MRQRRSPPLVAPSLEDASNCKQLPPRLFHMSPHRKSVSRVHSSAPLVRRVGDKVECVWPGDSGYQFQITSVHRLAIGFPGGRKVALDPFTIKEMGPRWAQRLAQGIPGSQATTGFTTCARFSRTSSTHGWNIHNNTSVRWQLLGSAQ